MIAVDTNLLVYSHRKDSEWHAAALAILLELAEGSEPWAIPWPCIHEFFSVATNPRIFSPPSTPVQAATQIDYWMASPTLHVLSEASNHWATLSQLARAGRIVGPAIHDARVAAICIAHGVHQLWTADRDFSRIPDLKVRNPLIR